MNTADLPHVSILIPIRNEERYIRQCMDAVLAQEYPAERIEVLVADGMSTDKTREIIAAYQQKNANIFLFDNPDRITPIALNILMTQGKGDIFIRVDGHCVIDPDYVSNCVCHLQSTDAAGVGGPMHSIGEDHLSAVIALAMSSRFGVGNVSFRTESGKTGFVDTVPFPAYPRATIAALGLYDEELVRNQDDEYNYRIRENGGKILLADDVRSTYYSRGSLSKLSRQYYQYGYWKVRVLQKHPRQMSLRQFVPILFVLGLLASLLLTLTFAWGKIVLLALAAAYLFANLAASINIAVRKKWDFFWPLPIVFAIIHTSYGLGFLVGLFKFWNRWGDKTGKIPGENINSDSDNA